MIVHCAVCQTQFPPGTASCPRCGSADLMIGMATPGGTIVSAGLGGTLRITGTRHETVKGRFIRQSLKQEWSSKRHQMEYVERTFDRVERLYHEVCYHPATGEVVYEKHRPIEDQSPAAHGKRGKRR